MIGWARNYYSESRSSGKCDILRRHRSFLSGIRTNLGEMCEKKKETRDN